MNTQNEQLSLLVSQLNKGSEQGRLLIYGIGNIGREDDGLGILLIEKLESISLPGFISLQSNYQLNVEDSLEISNYDAVLFVDASMEEKAQPPFQVREIFPATDISFSTHAMTMEGILALCDQLYQSNPKAFVLTIPGYQWNIKDQLSEPAAINLKKTFNSVTECLLRSKTSIQ